MEILLIFIVLLLAFFIFVLVWIFKNPKRRKVSLMIGGTIAVLLLTYNLFLVDHDMKFIQSKVYPNLYLIKNEITERDSLHQLIKKLVVKRMNSDFIGKEDQYKSKNNDSPESSSSTDSSYSLDFYTYFKAWGTNPLGEAGTAHFIENKEDPGGFSSEELDHYEEYKIADFHIHFCEEDTVKTIGILHFYENNEITKRDTIINSL
jgi:hypothetical protein